MVSMGYYLCGKHTAYQEFKNIGFKAFASGGGSTGFDFCFISTKAVTLTKAEMSI